MKSHSQPSKWFPPALDLLISVRAYLSIYKAPQYGHALCTPSSSCTSSQYELAGWLPPYLWFGVRDTSVGRRSRECILNNESGIFCTCVCAREGRCNKWSFNWILWCTFYIPLMPSTQPWMSMQFSLSPNAIKMSSINATEAWGKSCLKL